MFKLGLRANTGGLIQKLLHERKAEVNRVIEEVMAEPKESNLAQQLAALQHSYSQAVEDKLGLEARLSSIKEELFEWERVNNALTAELQQQQQQQQQHLQQQLQQHSCGYSHCHSNSYSTRYNRNCSSSHGHTGVHTQRPKKTVGAAATSPPTAGYAPG